MPDGWGDLLDESYWEEVGERYGQEIFDSAANDLNGVIEARIDRYADPSATACDFGCGVGHYLQLLSPRFGRVVGLDHAESLVEQARRRCEKLNNVKVLRADLTRAKLPVGRSEFGVCANVLISEHPRLRSAILRSVRRGLRPGGIVVILVPSLESALFANQHLVEWNRRRGFSQQEALEAGLPPTRRTARELLEGLVRIEGVATKHYLREEAVFGFVRAGFEMVAVEKVEYAWSTEFDRPPSWMNEPLPWDWLITLRRG
ncbi:class I SAM-dependent methyltransferase [Myxococcota bacterium]|nr:class I SAM-dependent methyltransferase [Myxococcota bacterium]